MAEGNGLLNRRRGINSYRGFESRPLRSFTDKVLALTDEQVKDILFAKMYIDMPESARPHWDIFFIQKLLHTII